MIYYASLPEMEDLLEEKGTKKVKIFSKKGLTRKARHDILKNAAGKKRGARKRARGGKSDLEN